MSFWGGFVEGFATEVGKAIDKDVERTNELVDDTIKIGLNKYLENEEEIKKEKKTIRDEIDTLVGLNFSLPKAASIVKAGLTTQLAKLALDEDYRGDPNKLWDGTTKYSEESGLTVRDVVNKLVKTPKFDVGRLAPPAVELIPGNCIPSILGILPPAFILINKLFFSS